MHARLNVFTMIAAGLLAALTCLPTHAQSDDTLSVITYNVQFLPGMASSANKRKEPVYRADHIAEEMSAYDIVALQETFHVRFRQQIIDGIQGAWGGKGHALVSPDKEGHFTNGGCIIITRLPVLETNAMVFTHFSSPKDYGVRADGHAAKGVIHARIARDADSPDAFVDVFVTHLEARQDELRPEQYKEMAAFIKEYSDPAHPMLLMGDLNTRGNPEYRADPKSQYSQLMMALRDARPDGGITDVWPALHGDTLGGTTEQESADVGKRIDYVLVGNPASTGWALRPERIEVRLFQDDKVVALSDHNAVAAEFTWSAP